MSELLKEIPITDIEHIKIGHAQDYEGATGCTVIISEQGAVTGVDIRGGGPASRECALLNPLAANDGVHAILLSGGSAFGLDAAGGVAKYLEERNIGFPVGVTKVPIVCASSLFDLQLVSHQVRPDGAMGYQACKNAEKNQPLQGNVGAGTGATVGKARGTEGMMKSGLGIYGVQLGELKVGAIVAVNALGDVYDYKTQKKLAGLLDYQTGEFQDTEEVFFSQYAGMKNLFTGNTTIGAILTNAAFTKTEMTKIAGMAHNGYARAIRPVHTTADGDSIYCMGTGEVKADLNVTGMLAARVMAQAIRNAVWESEGMYGLKAARDIVNT
ncbi:MAG: P1 family peptidase [Lachnospiraceae bacterium]|nr:P1 family peptidase [Lachnospiraceae bacterium]